MDPITLRRHTMRLVEEKTVFFGVLGCAFGRSHEEHQIVLVHQQSKPRNKIIFFGSKF